MIERSYCRLAPATGLADMEMVAANHCGQTARAINHGCVTDIQELQDANGKLNKYELLIKDKGFNQFCTGWSANVFSWQRQVAWPHLAGFVSRTANAKTKLRV